MDNYYVCVDDGTDYLPIATEDNYYDAVITAVVASRKYRKVVVIHGTEVVWRT